jgi:hypothetical protein
MTDWVERLGTKADVQLTNFDLPLVELMLAVISAADALGPRSCQQIPEKVAFTSEEWEAMKCHECPPCRLNAALAALREAVENAG